MNIRLRNFVVGRANRKRIEIFRFLVAGAFAFLVDFSLLVLLTEVFHLFYIISATLSFVIGLIVNYIICAKWVFDNSRLSNKYMEFMVFGFIGLSGVVLNALFIWIFTEVLGLHYSISKMGATLIIVLANFIAKKYVLFSVKEFK